ALSARVTEFSAPFPYTAPFRSFPAIRHSFPAIRHFLADLLHKPVPSPPAGGGFETKTSSRTVLNPPPGGRPVGEGSGRGLAGQRWEEHTSELQSRFGPVCRLLL